jgi:hypothetical protein
VQSSTIVRARKARPSQRVSRTKSMLQRSVASAAAWECVAPWRDVSAAGAVPATLPAGRSVARACIEPWAGPAAQHSRQLPIAPSELPNRERLQSLEQRCVGRSYCPIPLTRAREAGEPTRATLRDSGGLHRKNDGRPPLLGLTTFFPAGPSRPGDSALGPRRSA